jgi:hypothetical protein
MLETRAPLTPTTTPRSSCLRTSESTDESMAPLTCYVQRTSGPLARSRRPTSRRRRSTSYLSVSRPLSGHELDKVRSKSRFSRRNRPEGADLRSRRSVVRIHWGALTELVGLIEDRRGRRRTPKMCPRRSTARVQQTDPFQRLPRASARRLGPPRRRPESVGRTGGGRPRLAGSPASDRRRKRPRERKCLAGLGGYVVRLAAGAA